MKLWDIQNKDFIICLFYEITNEILSYEAQDLQEAFESIAKKKFLTNQRPLNLNKNNSSQALHNNIQNSNSAINKDFHIQSQNNINLQLQNSISQQMNYKFNFNNTSKNNNNIFKYNNQQTMENISEVRNNPNNLIYNRENQNNNNILFDLNTNKTFVNFSPNNFYNKSSFDSSEYIREVDYKTVYQKSPIPIYINQEYDILEEEKINYINEGQEKKIGFL